jgi:hypothetical protein
MILEIVVRLDAAERMKRSSGGPKDCRPASVADGNGKE